MEWDYLIVGSGFGGSASALRLVEKGYRVLLLEKGERLRSEDFPQTNWNLKRWLWLPALGFRGLFKMTFFRHLTAMSGVGVGGGSLVYANTMPLPPDNAFESGTWAGLAHWKEELAAHYQTAQRMMGVAQNPTTTRADEVLKEIAVEMGRGEHAQPAQVAIHFGTPGLTVADPYFNGDGPPRSGCIQCGACMTGCRHNAKNTLDKNYLYLAERHGLAIEENTEATSIRPLDDDTGYEVRATKRGPDGKKSEIVLRSHKVILAGGVLGTIELLARMKEQEGALPNLSPRLGHGVRTNSEVLIGITSREKHDHSQGIAIGSIFHTDDHSHIEPVRYGSGSGFFRLLTLPHARGASALARLWSSLLSVLLHPIKTLRWLFVMNWAKHTTILLYMRSLEGTLRLRLGRSFRTGFRRGLVSEVAEGPHPTASIPEASDIGQRVAEKMHGFASSMTTEVLLGIPTTAHLLGGCTMGDSAETGVIDHKHRVFGYPRLYVVDGSTISGNLGVNPSLTILALAERAMSFIPPCNEVEPSTTPAS